MDWYDYGARNYDAAIGLWRTPDELQEEHPDFSSYVYGYNNPMRISDPDGRDGHDKVMGYFIGAITNLIPFSGKLRDSYQPKDREDYNYSLRQTDVAVGGLGNGLNKIGGGAVGAGSVAVAASTVSLATTGGLSAEISLPVAAGGATLMKAGAIASVAGNLMMANSQSNKSQGYDRGKKSNVSSGNKNSPHANQKRKEVNKDKYKQLKAEYDRLSKIPNKTPEIKAERNRVERQLKRAQQRGSFNGENHSRNSKGNR